MNNNDQFVQMQGNQIIVPVNSQRWDNTWKPQGTRDPGVERMVGQFDRIIGQLPAWVMGMDRVR